MAPRVQTIRKWRHLTVWLSLMGFKLLPLGTNMSYIHSSACRRNFWHVWSLSAKECHQKNKKLLVNGLRKRKWSSLEVGHRTLSICLPIVLCTCCSIKGYTQVTARTIYKGNIHCIQKISRQTFEIYFEMVSYICVIFSRAALPRAAYLFTKRDLCLHMPEMLIHIDSCYTCILGKRWKRLWRIAGSFRNAWFGDLAFSTVQDIGHP